VRCRLLSHVEEEEEEEKRRDGRRGEGKIKTEKESGLFSSSLRIFDFAYPTPGER